MKYGFKAKRTFVKVTRKLLRKLDDGQFEKLVEHMKKFLDELEG